MTSVFGIREHFPCLREDLSRKLDTTTDRSILSKEIAFTPILPRLQRRAVDLKGEAYAEALVDMHADKEHLRSTREVRAFFPKCAVGCVIVCTDA